jgi:hypothetical protein
MLGRKTENIELIWTINRSFKHHPKVHGFGIEEVRKGYITAQGSRVDFPDMNRVWTETR